MDRDRELARLWRCNIDSNHPPKQVTVEFAPIKFTTWRRRLEREDGGKGGERGRKRRLIGRINRLESPPLLLPGERKSVKSSVPAKIVRPAKYSNVRRTEKSVPDAQSRRAPSQAS